MQKEKGAIERAVANLLCSCLPVLAVYVMDVNR